MAIRPNSYGFPLGFMWDRRRGCWTRRIGSATVRVRSLRFRYPMSQAAAIGGPFTWDVEWTDGYGQAKRRGAGRSYKDIMACLADAVACAEEVGRGA